MATADVNGLPMAYEVAGSGDPIVLVAGTGYPGATWLPELVGRLAQRHTVLTFDHRGTGATPIGKDRLTTRQMAADAVGLMDVLGLPAAHVVGHSMGGRVAQWMALDAPGRTRTLTLAASGSGQWNPDKPVTRGIPVHSALDLVEHGYEQYMRDHIRATFFTPEFAEAHPERVEWLIDAFWSHRPTLEAYLRHIVARQEHETTARLGELTLPTFILIGDRDTHEGGTGVHWDASEFLLRQLPNAVRRVMHGATHGYFWQQPEASGDALLEFIQES
jgi:pimeloyl-ACP methyl ester carboxylesterase